jgi:hypothetical protein
MRYQFFASLLRATAGGALMTVSSTAVACVGALFVERTAHRTLYRFFPHLYRDIDQAFGLEPYMLDAVRVTKSETNCTLKGQSNAFASNSERIERNDAYNDTTASSCNIFNVAIHS